jgi:hypothetical protein
LRDSVREALVEVLDRTKVVADEQVSKLKTDHERVEMHGRLAAMFIVFARQAALSVIALDWRIQAADQKPTEPTKSDLIQMPVSQTVQ